MYAATCLDGVESLIENRARADVKDDPRLIRISVGVEDVKFAPFFVVVFMEYLNRRP